MPISGYFDKIFAVDGDKVTVPDALQGDGTVSYDQGYPIGYSTPVTSGGILVTRTSMNQLFYDLTSAIQQYQQNGIPPFITSTMNGGSPFSYAQYAVVLSGGIAYQSLTNSNTDTPPSANWQQVQLTGSFSTGDTKETYKTTADTGWIMMNDGTIGNAASGATTRANADTAALFTLLWNNCSNTACPVSGGRGANAAADFAANKTLNLPLRLGRATATAGAGAGLTSRALGAVVGEETHTLNAAESAVLTYTSTPTDPGHTHTVGADADGSSGGSVSAPVNYPGALSYSTSSSTTGITVATSSNAGGGGHNNMQPTSFLNVMVKL